jgi:membrane protease YdiL (CAAX protease family)
MNYIYTAFIECLFVLLLTFPALKEKKTQGLVLFLILSIFSYSIANRIIFIFPELKIGLHWNWEGKILSTILCLAFIILLKKKFRDIDFGLTLKQKKNSIKSILIVFGVFLIIESVAFHFFWGKRSVTLEEHLFQLTMPGLSEEIAYRGLFLGILNEIFRKTKTVLGANLGYGSIVVTILFAFSHGFTIDKGMNIELNLTSMIIPLISIMFIWMKSRSGSLLSPILTHNVSNEWTNLLLYFK